MTDKAKMRAGISAIILFLFFLLGLSHMEANKENRLLQQELYTTRALYNQSLHANTQLKAQQERTYYTGR